MTIGTLYFKKSCHNSVPSPMRPNNLWTCPDDVVVNVVVVGPMEEDKEEVGVASDVVKAKGENPDTPCYLRGDRVRLGRQRSRIVDASPLARSR
jgi:hypothetical protein